MPPNLIPATQGRLIHVDTTAHPSGTPSTPSDQSPTTEAAASLSRRRPSTPDSEGTRVLDHKHAVASPPKQVRTLTAPPPTPWSSPENPPLRHRATSIASPPATDTAPPASDIDPFVVGHQVYVQTRLPSTDPNCISLEQAVDHLVAIGRSNPDHLPWLFSGFTQGLDLPHLCQQPGGQEQAQQLLNQIVGQLMARSGEISRHDLQRCLHAIALASHTEHPRGALHRVDYAPGLKGADRLMKLQDGQPVWERLGPREAARFLFDPQARMALGDQAFIPDMLGSDSDHLGEVAAWANGLQGVYLTPLLSGNGDPAQAHQARESSAPLASLHEPSGMPAALSEVEVFEPSPEVGAQSEGQHLLRHFYRLENLSRPQIIGLRRDLEGADEAEAAGADAAQDDRAGSPALANDEDIGLALFEAPQEEVETEVDADFMCEMHSTLLAWKSAYKNHNDACDVLARVSDERVDPEGIQAAVIAVQQARAKLAVIAGTYLQQTHYFGELPLAEQIDHWLNEARQRKMDEALEQAMETGLPKEAIESYLAAAESMRDKVAREAIENAAHNKKQQYTTEIGDLAYRIRQENEKEEVDTVKVSRLQGEIDLREILLRTLEGQLKDALWQAKQRTDDIGRIFEHRSLAEGAPALGKIEFLRAVLEGQSLKRWDTD